MRVCMIIDYGILQFVNRFFFAPIPVFVRSKAYVCSRSLPGIAVSNPAGDLNLCQLCVVCCQVQHPKQQELVENNSVQQKNKLQYLRPQIPVPECYEYRRYLVCCVSISVLLPHLLCVHTLLFLYICWNRISKNLFFDADFTDVPCYSFYDFLVAPFL
jgi:hypothetical protein